MKHFILTLLLVLCGCNSFSDRAIIKAIKKGCITFKASYENYNLGRFYLCTEKEFKKRTNGRR